MPLRLMNDKRQTSFFLGGGGGAEGWHYTSNCEFCPNLANLSHFLDQKC